MANGAVEDNPSKSRDTTIVYRAKLDADEIFRLYSHHILSKKCCRICRTNAMSKVFAALTVIASERVEKRGVFVTLDLGSSTPILKVEVAISEFQ